MWDVTQNKVLAFAGKKQSGKNTAFNLLLGIEMVKLLIVREKIEITPFGQLWVSDIFGDTEYSGIFDADRETQTMRDFLKEYIYPYIKNYSFADSLKRDICMNLLGLTHEMCYGTNTQRNQLTDLKWENMPGCTNRQGQMTAREVMQYVGTDIFRRMNNDCWVQACINKITTDNSLFAIITDCRFPNEVDAIHKIGGKVIKFTRQAPDADSHQSETLLDKHNYNWNNFDAVLDNAQMSISEQNEALLQLLYQWGWTNKIDTQEK